MFYIEVKSTPDLGRGVFAQKNFKIGEVIEICPVVPIEADESKIINETVVGYYHFEWQEQMSCLPLGYGMIYNHTDIPNATYTLDFDLNSVTFRALRPIKKGEQIFINYCTYIKQPFTEMFDSVTKQAIIINHF